LPREAIAKFAVALTIVKRRAVDEWIFNFRRASAHYIAENARC